MGPAIAIFISVFVLFVLIGVGTFLVRLYHKVEQGTAIVRTGLGGPKVSFSGIIIYPFIHRKELMDISVKRIEINRRAQEGLVCRDNIRADIKVAFFVRVNKNEADVLKVAQLLGCERGSQREALVELFDAKFSDALKTVGKQFDFVELYTERERFRNEILKNIGEDLNGYVLDGASIDYLEQTPKENLNPDNILDAEGIKKISDLTAREAIITNGIQRDKEKTIRKQDVEAREAILELDRQQAEAEETQAREIATITARERAEAKKVEEEQRWLSEQARLQTEEEIAVREQNKERQVIVAMRNKERTDKVEAERVERDRALEATEREKLVSVAQVQKDKAIEEENKIIQETIRERVMVEHKVVEEQENIKNTQEFMTADRAKRVAVTVAEQEAEAALVKEVKQAEADKESAQRHAEQLVIEAEAQRDAAERETAAKKMLAEATTAETAAPGLGEAKVTEAKAAALEKEGTAEATVMQRKFDAEAEGINKKAEAMKLFHDAGREHEEFKLRLNKDKDVELAAIDVQRQIAAEQSEIVGQALKSARIDIVGGDNEFFDRIVNSVTGGKAVDRYVNNSYVLRDMKETFFNGDPEYFERKLTNFLDMFQISSENVRDLSISAVIAKMLASADNDATRADLEHLLEMAHNAGLARKPASSVTGKVAAKAGGSATSTKVPKKG
jgi:uncharacterized membrane protein YqiK